MRGVAARTTIRERWGVCRGNTTLDGVTMYPNAARSYSDVSTDAIFFDAIKMASGYMLMFIYTIFMLGKLNSVEIKGYLAIVGIASVGVTSVVCA